MGQQGELCGLWVDGEVRYHEQGEILVFDDSRRHKAFNHSKDKDRVVLILDLLRPRDLPLGTAFGGHTDDLDDLLSKFS